jgi:hypothetical protein
VGSTKALSPKEKPNRVRFSCNIVDTDLDSGIPTFVWEPQEAFSPATQNYDQCSNLSLKIYPESFR